MKISYRAPASLLATVVLMQHAASAPQVERQLPRVSYAGINIAGCDFGIDVNVNLIYHSWSLKNAKRK